MLKKESPCSLSPEGQAQLAEWESETKPEDTKGFRSCTGKDGRDSDCKHLKAYVSWWCVNEDAREWRGTLFPGACNCPFWQPREKTSWRKFRDFLFAKDAWP